jgi:hypothetical protein
MGAFRLSGASINLVRFAPGDGFWAMSKGITSCAIDCVDAVCKHGLDGIVSKKLNAPYRSGPSKTWIKVKNPNAPAATRAIDGTF